MVTTPALSTRPYRWWRDGSARRYDGKAGSQVPERACRRRERVPGTISAAAWYGFVVPKGTPQDVIEKLRASTVAALATPVIKERLESEGTTIIGDTPQEFAAMMQSRVRALGGVLGKEPHGHRVGLHVGHACVGEGDPRAGMPGAMATGSSGRTTTHSPTSCCATLPHRGIEEKKCHNPAQTRQPSKLAAAIAAAFSIRTSSGGSYSSPSPRSRFGSHPICRAAR